MQKPIIKQVSLAIVVFITNHALNAGAFSLYTESSTVAVGNFAAGIAAEAADASIGWYNPAGLVLLHEQQAVLSGIGVLPSFKISGTSTYTTQEVAEPYVQPFSNLQGAQQAVVPAFHYAHPLGNNVTFGLSLVAPFGLSSSWPESSAVRYSGTLTSLKTIRLSPEMGGRLSDHFSIGAGLDLEWAQVTFNNVVGNPAFAQELSIADPGVTPTIFDSTLQNTGDAFNVGFHAGLMLMFNDDHTRLGLNYQSQMGHIFQGTSTMTGRMADPWFQSISEQFVSDSLITNEINFPDILTVSAYQDISNRIALLASAVYTGWSSYNEVGLNGVAAISEDTLLQAPINVLEIENYHDTWRYALGANYRFTDHLLLRLGGGYDQTPTSNTYRSIRLPDSDRWALSVGGHYQPWANIGFDVGYTYLFAATDATPIDKVQHIGTISQDRIVATANNHAQLVGIQVVWREAPVMVTK